LRLLPEANSGSKPLRVFYLIVRREFMTRVRTRFFQIGTGVLILATGGYVVLAATVLSNASKTKVGFAGEAQALAAPFKAAAESSGAHVQILSLASVAAGEKEIRAGNVDAVVSGDQAGPTVTVRDRLVPTVAALLNGIVRQMALDRALSTNGVDPASVNTRVAAARIHVSPLDPAAGERSTREGTGAFIATLLYVALLLYGHFVAEGVVEEKVNRIVEILLSAVSSRQLLFGKVIGVGLVGVTQLLLVGVSALVMARETGTVSLSTVGMNTVAIGLLWFVLGFVFYALLFAAAGSTVSRQEEVGTVTTPITFFVIGAYLAFFWMLLNPDQPIAIAVSMLPGLAPFMMPARMVTGDALAWQVALAVGLSIAGIVALHALAARIYANSVLRTGARLRLREAWGRPGKVRQFPRVAVR